ncbi:FkbM family methyltransferase [Marivita hallyeonensis]|nr:FkbM family methyltransferase [Marivita hallyeonensis]
MIHRTRRPQTAIGRSLDVYYRDDARNARMDALNAQFVREGSLAFDIGAHVGDRTGSFLRLGARVVALEPQPRVFRALRLIHGRSDRTTLVCAAAGERPGSLELHVNTANPTVSTASPEFIAAAAGASEWRGQVWDERIEVPVTTLDHLIAGHGAPDFIKIDVEGHELAALRGLTRCVPALSFEFTTIQRETALECLRYVSSLGPYWFNYSLGEDHKLIHPDWIGADAIGKELMNLPMSANSGDVFAQLV